MHPPPSAEVAGPGDPTTSSILNASIRRVQSSEGVSQRPRRYRCVCGEIVVLTPEEARDCRRDRVGSQCRHQLGGGA